MQTLVEALQRLRIKGYTDEFRAEAGLLRSLTSGKIYAPETLRVDQVIRFEGESDPADESAVFALTCEGDGANGTYTVAYGPAMDAADAEVVPRLRYRDEPLP